MRYKLRGKHMNDIVPLKDISSMIQECEIYEVEEDKETYLGYMSVKKIIYIATDNLDYAINNNFIQEELEMTKRSFNICRAWLQEPLSISESGLRDFLKYIFSAKSKEKNLWKLYELELNYNILLGILYCMNPSTYNSSLTALNWFFDCLGSCSYKDIGNNYIDNTDNLMTEESEKEKELIRQGNSIIYFLKSDKNLFMV